MESSSQVPSEVRQRTIFGHTLYSTHLQENRTVKVVLPPGYESYRNLPVVYCHDGGEFLTHGRIATLATKMVTDGELNPIVIVAAHVNKAHRNDDYAITGNRNDAYNRFIVEELLPFVEQTYPVSQDASARFMAGVSLGAHASMVLHLRYPDLFSQLLLFSGAFYNELMTAMRDFGPLSLLHAWMLAGRNETAVDTQMGAVNFYELNHNAHGLLIERGAHIDYLEDEGTHIWGFWQRHIPDALAWLQRRLDA